MSKRTPGLPRRPNEWWATPPEAVIPLIPYLPQRPTAYAEPMAGDGALVRALAELWPWGTCALASDVAPRAAWIEPVDVLELTLPPAVEFVISNPPWPQPGRNGQPAVQIAAVLAEIRPSWLLLPWAMAANRYFGALSRSCAQIVPVGRVSWMGNGQGGYDDCAWYYFDARHAGPTVLRPRGSA